MKKKNIDIQLLRATAIIAVLGFHLRPEYVPQGYLGVDIFFAISGYLITVILDKKRLTLSTCFKFYERRLKRLLPVYSIVILSTLIIASFFIISIDYDFLKTDTLWSMAFATNFQSMFEEETYFSLIIEYKFLLHTWSLSVEMQYYFLAPIILIPVGWCANPLVPLIAISGLSWIFQSFVPYSTISFGFVFTRIWQFSIGSIAFYATSKMLSELITPDKVELMNEDEAVEDIHLQHLSDENHQLIPYPHQPRPSNENQHLLKYLRFLTFVAILFICFMPKLSDDKFYEIFVRLVSTMLGGISIFLGTLSNSYEHVSIFTEFLIYVGDISYSVYLIHWPVIILAKYLMVFETTQLCQIIAIIFGISIAQYHLFEQPLRRQSSKVTFLICALIYGLVIFTLYQPQSFGYVHSIPHPSIAANEQIAANCGKSVTECNWDPEMLKIAPMPRRHPAFFCSYNGTGNATIFLTGNSFAIRALPEICKALESKYKTLYFAARSSCLAFESFNGGISKHLHCDEIFNKTIQFLERFKPDFLIISQKLNVVEQFQKPLNSTEAYLTDNTTIEVARYLKMFSNFTQKIFVIEPNPTVPYNPALELAKEISQKKDISRHTMELKEITSQIHPGWSRIKAALKECPKCVAVDLQENYIKNRKFVLFDSKTKLSYFCDETHLSPPGLGKMMPAFIKFFNAALKQLYL